MTKTKSASGKRISVLDLYSGLGGISLGFEMTGAFRTVAGLDNYKWAVEAFYENHPEIRQKALKTTVDLSSFEPSRLLDTLGESPDMVVGGPPCQGFSDAGKRLPDLMADPRNHQVFRFFEFVRGLRPKAFLMENVSGILRTGQRSQNALLEMLCEKYKEEGYSTSWRLVNSAEYRVPQVRKRLILVGVRDSSDSFVFPEPIGPIGSLFSRGEEFRTVLDALGDLPTPKPVEPQPYESAPQTKLQEFLRQGSDALYNHTPTNHSPEMLEKLKKQTVGTRLYGWNHSWFKLDPSKPAPTVKQNNRAPSVHFREPRCSSPRECARLQTVPDRFILPGTKTAQLILLGNAVPPVLAAHLATSIAKQVFGVDVPTPWNSKISPIS
jgi:DNA (cytosine-5)-methyltransferase 1